MKQARRILPALAVLAFLCVFCTLLTAAADVVTVSTSAELSSAVSTLSATGGTIRFAGNIALPSSLSLPKNSARITIDGDGYTLRMNGNLALNGDMDFANIRLYNAKGAGTTGDYISVYCCGHDVHFRDTVTCGKAGLAYPSIMAGSNKPTGFADGRLTIDGGTWQRVRGGNASTGNVKQCAEVTINGGEFHEYVQLGGSGQMAAGSAVTLRINGGSLLGGIRFYSGTSSADLTLIVRGGSVAGNLRICSSGSASLSGKCTIRLLGGDFSDCNGIVDANAYPNLDVKLQINKVLADKICGARNTTTLSGTLLHLSMADPCMIYSNGFFYLTATGKQNIALLKSASLAALANLSVTTTSNYVYESALDNGAKAELGYTTLSGTWSPELHYFSEEDFPGQSGWYMYLAIRKDATVNGHTSAYVRMVALKSSAGNTPDGPYVHPVTGAESDTQIILNGDGSSYDAWGCGQTILRIKDGEYRGIYMMWVAEEGRGTEDFIQKIMIARMKSPWQIEGEPSAILTPTEYWETIGSEGGHPKVVEGAAPVYGKNGEIFLLYCGSGYWTNYGLGQATWTGGNPLLASSWVKYADNPVFGANDKDGNHYYGVEMQGAGHAFFLRDADDNLFAVYHAYPADKDGSNVASGRNAYIEACTVDYTKSNGVNNGVVTFQGGNRPAPTDSTVKFVTRSKFQPMADFGGAVTTAVPVVYNAAYDKNDDGICDIRDALLVLQGVIDGDGGTLADVFKVLTFIAD